MKILQNVSYTSLAPFYTETGKNGWQKEVFIHLFKFLINVVTACDPITLFSLFISCPFRRLTSFAHYIHNMIKK